MVILWDFYDTIASRKGTKGGWATCVWELLHEFGYNKITVDQVRPFLADFFPWNHHSVPHTDFFHGMEWWEKMNLGFERIFLQLGADIDDAPLMAAKVEAKYSDSNEWVIYPDAMESLEYIIVQGNTNVIVSNFYPDIAPLIEHLGLSKYFKNIYSSGQVGYEKPHPGFYKYVLSDLNVAASDVIMIGDNYLADIVGASQMDIKAILVHSENTQNHPFYSKDLKGILDFI